MREELGNRSVIIENGLCGSDLPSDIIVPGATAIVSFISRSSISAKRFSATWSMSKLPILISTCYLPWGSLRIFMNTED